MSKLNTETQTIEDVMFVYTKIQKPAPKFNPAEGNEYSVDVFVDKATRTAWNKEFPKNKAKEIEYADFVEKFGEENAIGTDEQYYIKLKKGANYKDKQTGELKEIAESFRPRAFIDGDNGELEDITYTKLIGNGSRGTVQYEVNVNDFGKFANLLAIKVDTLIEYKQADSSDKFGALGKVGTLAKNPNASNFGGNGSVGGDSETASDEDAQW